MLLNVFSTHATFEKYSVKIHDTINAYVIFFLYNI